MTAKSKSAGIRVPVSDGQNSLERLGLEDGLEIDLDTFQEFSRGPDHRVKGLYLWPGFEDTGPEGVKGYTELPRV